VLDNQGLSAVAFFEATAFLILLVLFILLRKDHPTRFLAEWIAGWTLLTIKSFLELTQMTVSGPQFRLIRVLLLVAANLVCLKSVIRYTERTRSNLSSLWSGSFVLLLMVYFFESRQGAVAHATWFTAILLATVDLGAGWFL
jgi:hypothetical protein